MSFKICNPMDNGITMEQITQTINESENLVVALESVAAMYGIPSTNVLSDPLIKNIRVEGDTIIAPPVTNVSGNAKAIIQSIGAVMDYVSQRVDDKLNNFQHDCVKKNKLMAHISREANPSKGQVVSRHIDDDGNEILVYDSGLIDAPVSEASRKLIKKLKEKGLIPDGKECKKCKDNDEDEEENLPQSSYFSDEDDITIGTSLHESANPISKDFKNYESPLTDELGDEAPEPVTGTKVDIGGGVSADEVDMSDEINESADILDLMARYGDTRYLGYSIMMEQGIDFVKPVIYQEADEEKKIKPSDVSHMKFDNKHILTAIKLINEIRSEEYDTDKRIKKINYFELVNNEKFKKALDELSAQFDCRLTFKVLTHREGAGNVCTPIDDHEVKHKVTVSKSKGFQLNGLPISIVTYNSFIEKSVPDDPSLFGQYFVSIMCHEIFHNISSALRVLNTSVNACVASGLKTAAKTKNHTAKKVIIGNLVDTISSIQGVSIPAGKKKKLVKDLTALSFLIKGANKGEDEEPDNKDDDKEKDKKSDSKDKKKKDDEKSPVLDKKESGDTIQEKVDKKVKRSKKLAKQIDNANKMTGTYAFGTILGVATALLGASAGPSWIITGLGITGLSVLGGIGRAIGYNKEKKDYAEGKQKDKKGTPLKNNEEFYCDMFAGMYGLPVTFFVLNSKNKSYTANDLRSDQLKALYSAEKELANSMKSSYPSTLERDYAALKIAKSTLNNKKDLDPAVKKYLEWIVDNYSETEKIGVENLYNKSTFDPGSAENLDSHLRKLITDSKITVTEYDLSALETAYDYDNEEDE